MDRLNQLKKKICKIGLIFIGCMLVLTILSKTIYTLLLPIVEIDQTVSGTIKTDFYAKGKIGYDGLLIKSMKVAIKTSQEGQVIQCNVRENDKVNAGDELIVIQSELDPEKQIEVVNAEREIEINIRAYEREKEKLEKEYQDKCNEITSKEKQIQDYSDEYELIELEDQIEQKQKEVDNNISLFGAGAISENEKQKSSNELNLLQEKQQLLKKEHDTKINDAIKELKQKITDLNNSKQEQEEKIEIEKNKLVALQEKQGTKVIRSPIEGTIYELKIGKGGIATQGEELLVIIPEEIPITLAFNLEQEIADKLEIDSEVTWTKDQREYAAKVIKKTYDQEKDSTIITCELDQSVVENWVIDYKTYKNVDVNISQVSGRYQCLVPTSAINFEGRDAFIYVLSEEDTVFERKYFIEKQQIRVIYQGDEKSAIEGVGENRQIVIATNKGLKNKMEVRLK